MIPESPPTGATMGTPRPTRRPRIRFAIRLRTMLLIVLAVAVLLGYRDYRKRRDAVDYLLSRVPVSVFIRSSPTFPDSDSTYDPGGTFAVAIRRVRELHQEETAVNELAVALREARISGDEKSMRGALAALQGLGSGLKAAGPEVARVVRGEGLTVTRLDEYTDVRALAIHVLAMIARDDEERLRALIAALGLPDPSPHKILAASVANELVPFGSKTKAAVPALIAILEDRTKAKHQEDRLRESHCTEGSDEPRPSGSGSGRDWAGRSARAAPSVHLGPRSFRRCHLPSCSPLGRVGNPVAACSGTGGVEGACRAAGRS